jgi:hypothetical protein
MIGQVKVLLAITLTIAVVTAFFVPRTVAQTVSLTPTKTEVVTLRMPTIAGQEVALTAYVKALGPNPGVPTGIVDFYSADTLLATATLSEADGEAAGSVIVTLPAGIHPIIARYQGDQTYAFSISAPPVPQEVFPE